MTTPEPSPDGMRRAELVDRAQAGDVGAFGELYDEYSLTVYRYIYARVSSSALAEDLTSETFVRALRALDSFRWQGRDFGAWLVTIARNLITDHYKSGRVRLEVVTDEIETHDRQTEGPEIDVLAAATAEVLRDAVAGLPDEQRDCLTMRFFAGPACLVIDELGYLPLPGDGAAALFQVINQRYLKSSTILCTNVGIADWANVFGDATAAAAMLDRLLHRAAVVGIDGPSYRLRSHQKHVTVLREGVNARVS